MKDNLDWEYRIFIPLLCPSTIATVPGSSIPNQQPSTINGEKSWASSLRVGHKDIPLSIIQIYQDLAAELGILSSKETLRTDSNSTINSKNSTNTNDSIDRGNKKTPYLLLSSSIETRDDVYWRTLNPLIGIKERDKAYDDDDDNQDKSISTASILNSPSLITNISYSLPSASSAVGDSGCNESNTLAKTSTTSHILSSKEKIILEIKYQEKYVQIRIPSLPLVPRASDATSTSSLMKNIAPSGTVTSTSSSSSYSSSSTNIIEALIKVYLKIKRPEIYDHSSHYCQHKLLRKISQRVPSHYVKDIYDSILNHEKIYSSSDTEFERTAKELRISKYRWLHSIRNNSSLRKLEYMELTLLYLHYPSSNILTTDDGSEEDIPGGSKNNKPKNTFPSIHRNNNNCIRTPYYVTIAINGSQSSAVEAYGRTVYDTIVKYIQNEKLIDQFSNQNFDQASLSSTSTTFHPQANVFVGSYNQFLYQLFQQ